MFGLEANSLHLLRITTSPTTFHNFQCMDIRGKVLISGGSCGQHQNQDPKRKCIKGGG